MPANALYPDPWIGHSQWRTLVSLESEIIAGIGKDSNDQNNNMLVSDWPSRDAEQVFRVCPVSELESAVFFLAGQSFLINAPKGVFEALHSSGKTLPPRVIVLSWEDQYIDGLIEYCYAYSKTSEAQKLEIYISEWGWDSVKNRAWNQLISEKQPHIQSYPYEFFLAAIESAGANSKKLETEGKIVPKVFKKYEHYRLFPQVEWRLSYSLAPTPCLQVQFRLFDSYLTITHRKPYPSEYYQEQILARIIQRYPSAVNDLRRVINLRLGDLIHAKDWEKPKGGAQFNLYHSFYTYNLLSKVLGNINAQGVEAQESLQVETILPEQLKNNEFQLETNWNECFKTLDRSHLTAAKALSWQTLERGVKNAERKRAAVAPRVFLAISCGGLSSVSGGQITPLTRVSINKMNLSLLGFKIYDFLKDQNSPEPIFQKKLILLVSPWTETNVRREISRLLWEFRTEFETISNPEDVLYLRQTMVPRCIREKNGIKYYKQDSFQFNPSGHYDFIKLLMDQNSVLDSFLEPSEEEDKKSSKPTLIYHTIYKNLGRNLNEKVRLLANYMETDASPTLLFELVKYNSEKGEGSYWVRSKRTTENKFKKHLIKPVYEGKQGLVFAEKGKAAIPSSRLFIEKTADQPHLLMSTASFIMDVGRLRTSEARFKKPPFYARPKLPLRLTLTAGDPPGTENVLQETLQFERDIDQVTEQMHCEGVEIETDEHGIEGRFIPIKQEKDLYQNKIKVLEKIWEGEGKEDEEFKKALPRHIPFLLEPDEKNDTWGGYRIRNAKELPAIDEKVSETWEASLHHKGVSGIKFDALHSVPLNTFLEDADLDVMFKLLDCNSWLSIQLHPDNKTCRSLRRHLKDIEREFTAVDWTPDDIDKIRKALSKREDDNGKEEMFYIVDNRNHLADRIENEPNLILGFHKNKLEKLRLFSESEWAHYKTLFQRAVSLNDHLFKAFKKDKIEKSAFWNLETFIKKPGDVLSEKYKECFSQLIDKHLPFILRFRQETTGTSLLSLRGVLFIFSMQAVKESLKTLKPAELRTAFSRSELPLFDFFYKICPKPGSILQIKPGMIHALGKGLFAVEASNRSNNTFRIFDHGRELSPTPRPLHYLLAAAGLSSDSFISKNNESLYVFPHEDFTSRDNIRLEVFNSGKLRRPQTMLFPREEALLLLCTKGVSRIKTIYRHIEKGVSNKTVLDLKEAYTVYIPATDDQFERTITVESNAYEEAECVVVSAQTQGNDFQSIDDSGQKPAKTIENIYRNRLDRVTLEI